MWPDQLWNLMPIHFRGWLCFLKKEKLIKILLRTCIFIKLKTNNFEAASCLQQTFISVNHRSPVLWKEFSHVPLLRLRANKNCVPWWPPECEWLSPLSLCLQTLRNGLKKPPPNCHFQHTLFRMLEFQFMAELIRTKCRYPAVISSECQYWKRQFNFATTSPSTGPGFILLSFFTVQPRVSSVEASL